MKKFSYPLISISTVIFLVYINIRTGFRWSPDSFVYNEISNLLVSENFNLFKFLSAYDYINQSYTILLPIFVFSVIKYIAPENWELLIFSLNIFLLISTFYLYYKASISIGISSRSTALTFLLFPLCVDFITWPNFYGTDMTYTFLVMLAFKLSLQSFHRGNFILYLNLVALMFTRLVSPAYIISILFSKFFINKIKSLNCLLILLMLVMLISIFGYVVVLKFFERNIYLAPDQIVMLLDFTKIGWIVHHRDEYLYKNSFTNSDILLLTFSKFLSFFFAICS